MKFYFSFIILSYSCYCFSSQVRVYYHPGEKSKALIVKQIFETKFSVPNQLIVLKKSQECHSQDARFLELCINKKGKLLELPNTYIDKIKKSIRTFSSEDQA